MNIDEARPKAETAFIRRFGGNKHKLTHRETDPGYLLVTNTENGDWIEFHITGRRLCAVAWGDAESRSHHDLSVEMILRDTTMIDQAQACQLLGLSGSNPPDRDVLRFTVDGRAAYPVFQFDVEGRRVFPALGEIIALKPIGWSDSRLLHWLTRPHLDFDGTPADALGTDGAAVVAAFAREIEPTGAATNVNKRHERSAIRDPAVDDLDRGAGDERCYGRC